MAEELPSVVSTFKVVGRLVKGVADSNDAGLQPEILPVPNATITFTPSLNPPEFRIPTAVPPVTVYQETIFAKTDENGYLVGPGDSTHGVVLVYGADPDLVPSGWTWTVTISPGGNFPSKTFSILGSPDGVYDLATLEPVPANVGEEVAYWEQVRNEVIVSVSPQADWSGAISLARAETMSKYLIRRLTGNTILTLASGESGKAYSCSLEIIQDGTGGRTLTIPGAHSSYGIVVPLTSAAGSVDIIRLEWNGSRWKASLSDADVKVVTGW